MVLKLFYQAFIHELIIWQRRFRLQHLTSPVVENYTNYTADCFYSLVESQVHTTPANLIPQAQKAETIWFLDWHIKFLQYQSSSRVKITFFQQVKSSSRLVYKSLDWRGICNPPPNPLTTGFSGFKIHLSNVLVPQTPVSCKLLA